MQPDLGHPWHLGLYSLADSVSYSAIPKSTLHRWLVARMPGLSLREQLVSFDELVSLLFVRELSRQHVRMKDILTAEDDLRERTHHRHPFAHEVLWTAGKDVMVRVPGSVDAFLSANRRGQMTLPGITEPHRVELPELVSDVRGQLGYEGGRVVFWRPLEHIVAKPVVQFGLTCIEGTRITTRALYEAASAGDDVRTLAEMFEVQQADVESALEWERRLAA